MTTDIGHRANEKQIRAASSATARLAVSGCTEAVWCRQAIVVVSPRQHGRRI
jgi:hypothetical protein